MILQNKILPVALVAALVGGTTGALVMRSRSEQPAAQVASASLLPASQAEGSQAAALRHNEIVPASTDATNSQQPVSEEEAAYRAGFTDGFATARDEGATTGRVAARSSAAPERVVYRNAPARRVRSSRASSRTVYYDYQPRKRSFWQKHRDKLTVAMGAGGGALVGGLVGGKKGALIGAGAGGGGAALYTYGIRKRDRRN